MAPYTRKSRVAFVRRLVEQAYPGIDLRVRKQHKYLYVFEAYLADRLIGSFSCYLDIAVCAGPDHPIYCYDRPVTEVNGMFWTVFFSEASKKMEDRYYKKFPETDPKRKQLGAEDGKAGRKRRRAKS